MLDVLAAFTMPLNLLNQCLKAHNEEDMPQLPICALETTMNKKKALICPMEDVLRGYLPLSQCNTLGGQIGINK